MFPFPTVKQLPGPSRRVCRLSGPDVKPHELTGVKSNVRTPVSDLPTCVLPTFPELENIQMVRET